MKNTIEQQNKLIDNIFDLLGSGDDANFKVAKQISSGLDIKTSLLFQRIRKHFVLSPYYYAYNSNNLWEKIKTKDSSKSPRLAVDFTVPSMGAFGYIHKSKYGKIEPHNIRLFENEKLNRTENGFFYGYFHSTYTGFQLFVEQNLRDLFFFLYKQLANGLQQMKKLQDEGWMLD